MSSAQQTNDVITPNIYLNSEAIGKVCLLSAENNTSVPPQHNEYDDAASVPDEIIHCSLPNLSPLHGNLSSVHHRKHCHHNNHPQCNRHTICYSNASMVHGNNGSSRSISAYCSPRAGRKHRPGSFSTKDLSSLRAECYLKCKQQKGSRTRLDSGDSMDSDHGTIDSASHISTCATSDYAYMTSLDTIAMLCKECQKCHNDYHQNHDNLTPALSELDLSTSLRRTHSNPENCKLTDDDEVISNTDDQQHVRDARSCSELNINELSQPMQDSTTTISAQGPYRISGSGVINEKAAVPRSGIVPKKSMQSKDGKAIEGRCLDRKKPCKSIAISEENLVSRVSRWLSTVDNGEVLESDIF